MLNLTRFGRAAAAFVQPWVKIESGAKSALDPNGPRTIRPYVEADLPGQDLASRGVTTVEAERTFRDKVVILHGLRRGQERMFFNREAFDLGSARAPTVALPGTAMLESLRREYAAMQGMIFGAPPAFEAISQSVAELEAQLNARAEGSGLATSAAGGFLNAALAKG